MSGNQPERLSGEPLNMGVLIFAPISSEKGSSFLSFSQPILTGSVFASTAVLISSQIFLFIARRFLNIKSIPVLDASNGQTVQMSLNELQEFLRWMANGIGESPNSSPVTDGGNGNILSNQNGASGFITKVPAEAPLTVTIYFSAFYSNNSFTPSVTFYIPILAFPGIRGALPLLILGLLSTIFVRSVVPPESTGAKLLLQPETIMNNTINNPMNNALPYSPNDLLKLLTKFGRSSGTN